MFDATSEFNESVNDVDKLLKMIELVDESINEDVIILKAAQVTLVSKFQVFIEAILNEFKEKITSSEVINKELPIFMRINSFRILFDEYPFLKKMENPNSYGEELLAELEKRINVLHDFCMDDANTSGYLKMKTKFPLGKTGTKELKNLFKQIDGNHDIFNDGSLDINVMDGILAKRHAVVHNDRNPHLSSEEVSKNIIYIKELADFIDSYLNNHINDITNGKIF